MTRNEMIERICYHFRLGLPETDDDGNYIINNGEWVCGGYVFGKDSESRPSTWQILIGEVLDGMFTDEDEDEDDDYE